MDYKLKLQPAVTKKGVKYKVIQITDIALHTSKKIPTPSVGKKIQKSFNNNKPDRIYSPIEKDPISNERTFILDLLKMDSDFVKMVQEEESKGYKVLIALPHKGIPIVAGTDTIEFMNSKNGKRIISSKEKKKDKE